MKKTHWALAALAGAVAIACVSIKQLSGPKIRVFTVGFSDREIDVLGTGMLQWQRLGFEIMSLNEKYIREEGSTDKSVQVLKAKVEDLPVAGRTLIAQNRIYIREDNTLEDLLLVGTHELGHYILNTSQHLAADKFGVMNGKTWAVTDDDVAFACAVANRCEDFWR